MAHFDTLTMIEIDLIALRLVEPLLPDEPCAAGAYVTDEIVERAIQEYFGTEPDWSDDLLPTALARYKETRAIDNAVRGVVNSFLGSLLGGHGGL